jgi:hypothetical protein
MCNQLTNEHAFTYASGSASAKIPDYIVCRCGAFRFDGKPTNHPRTCLCQACNPQSKWVKDPYGSAAKAKVYE